VQRPLDRAALNEMLQLVAANKWTEFVALTRVLAPVGEGQSPEALREQAQASLAKQQPEQAQQAVLEALLRDPQSGASWLMAARVFAERDASGPAESALRLAYYFARDRQQAMASLTEMAKGAEPKFKAVVNSQLPELSKIPAR
jgi:predicted Zn-dependent protease